jgi:hypothetical protein
MRKLISFQGGSMAFVEDSVTRVTVGDLTRQVKGALATDPYARDTGARG